jgi:hypothetical protein
MSVNLHLRVAPGPGQAPRRQRERLDRPPHSAGAGSVQGFLAIDGGAALPRTPLPRRLAAVTQVKVRARGCPHRGAAKEVRYRLLRAVQPDCNLLLPLNTTLTCCTAWLQTVRVCMDLAPHGLLPRRRCFQENPTIS